MKLARLWIGTLAIAAAVILLNLPAYADTYQIYNLTDGYRTDPIGITANGTVVLYRFGLDLCGLGSAGCYDTYMDGVRVNASDDAPMLTYDNGTTCVPDTAPGIGPIVAAVCNNGREVYGTSRYAPTPDEIYTGPDPVADLFGSGILDLVTLNSSGDFAYLEGNLGMGDGEYYEAIDLTTETPEPSSIFLLGTGLFAAAGMRRRLFQ